LPGTKNREHGELYLRKFRELADLSPEEAVLEPGCGTGRMAAPLTRYLTTGSYDGFDVVREAIEWCQKNIVHPNFTFRHVDVRNRMYNPHGRLDPARFKFPYRGGSFDFAFLTSVFTHMLPTDVRHYLNEIRRVLRPGGRCLMTFFVLNDASLESARAGNASRSFAHEGDGYFYDVREHPEGAVAYREENILAFLDRAGFQPQTIHYGRWSGRRSDVGQDIVVATRGRLPPSPGRWLELARDAIRAS
jgi:SAM-dependent methyltransferase